jgi:hypothetical protein
MLIPDVQNVASGRTVCALPADYRTAGLTLSVRHVPVHRRKRDRRVDDAPGFDAHPDAIMLWAGSQRWPIKNNRVSDGHGVRMSGSTTDVRFENDLIVRIKNLLPGRGHDRQFERWTRTL